MNETTPETPITVPVALKDPTPLKEIKTLLKQTMETIKAWKKSNLPLDPLKPMMKRIVLEMERLPIHEYAEQKEDRVMYFILCGGEWWPTHAGDVNRNKGLCEDWLSYNISYSDGTVETGTAPKYQWAHVTADNQVNFHWFDEFLEEN